MVTLGAATVVVAVGVGAGVVAVGVGAEVAVGSGLSQPSNATLATPINT